MKGPEEAYAASAVGWALARVGERTYPLRCLAFVERLLIAHRRRSWIDA